MQLPLSFQKFDLFNLPLIYKINLFYRYTYDICKTVCIRKTDSNQWFRVPNKDPEYTDID